METSELAKFADSEENSRIRAEIWGDFVGWDKRRRGENGFLVTQLKKHQCQNVVDIALGDGVDAIYLLQQGFNVSANEFDEAFRQKAVENAKKVGLNLSPTSVDWRNLTEAYPPSFDAVICMGNSLTCLFGRENQVRALREIHEVLKTGGILILDERNYQRILDNREAALSGELHSSGRYLYTRTDKIGTRFLSISDEAIYIEYAHKEDGKKAYYKVYPFKKGELLELLKEAGFSRIEQFSDYEPGENPDADFYQYVCVK